MINNPFAVWTSYLGAIIGSSIWGLKQPIDGIIQMPQSDPHFYFWFIGGFLIGYVASELTNLIPSRVINWLTIEE